MTRHVGCAAEEQVANGEAMPPFALVSNESTALLKSFLEAQKAADERRVDELHRLVSSFW